MPNIKGTSIVIIRKVLRKNNQHLEDQLLATLSPDLKKLYLNAMTTTWTPENLQGDLYQKCADVLFPKEKDKLFLLGKLIAENTYTGIYKIFLRIPNVHFVIKRWINIWKSFHDHGVPEIDNYTDHTIDLVVRQLPDLPATTRQVVSGHILAILELIGVKYGKVDHNDQDAKAWRWHINWED